MHRPICMIVFALAHSALAAAQTSAPASVRASSATEALQFLLEIGITPGGPIRADGSTIASILAGQSLTFPVSTSSGAFAARKVRGFGPDDLPLEFSTSGNFGSAFAERGLTNGRGNASASLTYQRLSWGSIGRFDLTSGGLVFRRVQTVPLAEGPAATADEVSARIQYATDVIVAAGSFGLLDRLDIGVSVPFVRAAVDGTKQRRVRAPGEEWRLLYAQTVTGSSEGIGDTILRLKWRLPDLFDRATEQPPSSPQAVVGERRFHRGTAIAVGLDVRLPTGKTDVLSLDCAAPPCGTNKLTVPDLGLGHTTARTVVIVSTAFPRFSPHLNLSYFYVPPYECDEHRFGHGGQCKGAVFEVDPVNGGQDAKAQGLTDELTGVLGVDFEALPYRATVSADLVGRQLIRAGQMFAGPARIVVRPDRPEKPLDDWASAEVETRHGNVNTLMMALGTKVRLRPRWVLVGTVLLPLAGNGLQPRAAWVFGLERALGR